MKNPGTVGSLVKVIRDLVEEVSGVDIPEGQDHLTFLELGLDSLVLTQVASVLQRRFKVQLSFRQLIEDLSSLDRLSEHLVARAPASALPAEPAPSKPAVPPNGTNTGAAPVSAPVAAKVVAMAPIAFQPPPLASLASSSDGLTETLIAQQLQLMMQQLELLRGGFALATDASAAAVEAPAVVPEAAPAPAAETSSPPEAPAPGATATSPAKAFGPQVRIDLSATGSELTQAQKDFIADLTRRYIERTRSSKEFTAKNRPLLADPRVVSGFKPVYKEMVYPIVVERSSGAKLWDIDGNQLVDITCGFGAHFFGHTPDWVVEAVTEQLKKGMEIGPQTPLAAEVAGLVRELTGFERVAFCNTGSEAVLGATRVCRTVTGRPLVVMFENDYHGIFDEVIVRGSKSLRSRPAAAGIPPESVQNTLILEYGNPQSLEIIKSRLDDIAAVLVEPVQGRRPELVPREFLVGLRELTEKSGTPLIFDEVITGFRIALGGAQEYFGIRADLATYGKVVGAGMPIAIIAGKSQYMDALDGGPWQFGDDSAPSVGVTYFAGTFVRHPPALAAARAALRRLKEDGGNLQRNLNARTDAFAAELNAFFEQVRAPIRIKNFGSLCKIWVDDNESHASLLWFELRLRGVHAWEGRPAFLTLGHTEEDIQFVVKAFKDSVRDLVQVGLLSGDAAALAALPPVPGARLGKDPQGNPAWFVADPQRPGKYMKVELS
jgi:glutamate-1-semialdehyde aminotransferase/acyl carrier protein